MVAAQPEQLQAEAQQGLSRQHQDACLLPAHNQAVGLDLIPQKPVAGAVDSSIETALLPADRLRYFNWDQRDTARAAMQTLVAALSEDPINSYFTGSRKRQRKFVKDEVKGYLKALPRAANFIATADSKAVALWQLLPAETPRNELWAGWTRILAVSPRKWGQLVRLELHYEEAHEAIAAAHGAYYYLSFIGTAPEARGRGLGSRLLQEITSRADREGRWCLLEATSEKSEALYARHGFVTYEAFKVSKKAPPVFLMKRAPASEAAAVAAGAAATAAPFGKAASGVPVLSPVFSIKAVSVSCDDDASSISSGSSSRGSDGDFVAAVDSKEAAAGSNGSNVSLPSSPQIAAAHGCVAAINDSLLLPAAAVSSSGKCGCKSEQQIIADAQVIIRSASSNSLLKESAAAAAAAAVKAVGSSNGSNKQGESPVEYGVCQDEAGCDSSSTAGAGGPCDAAAAGC